MSAVYETVGGMVEIQQSFKGIDSIISGRVDSKNPRTATKVGRQVRPPAMPVKPPTMERTMVSTRNCRVMSQRPAPKARRMPISRALLLTEKATMLYMPIDVRIAATAHGLLGLRLSACEMHCYPRRSGSR